MIKYDVAIIGAGPAGSGLAIRLSRAGIRVLLVESSNFDTPRVGESLAPRIKPLLNELGLWSNFLSLKPLESFGTSSYWGEDKPNLHSHMKTPYGLGWHVNRLAFDKMLVDQAVDNSTQLKKGTRFLNVDFKNNEWELNLKSKKESSKIKSSFLIDATGRKAFLARRLGVKGMSFDKLISIGVQVRDYEAPKHSYILIESCSHGWWYSAPISKNSTIVMFFTDGDLVNKANAEKWSELIKTAPETMKRIGWENNSTENSRIIWGPKPFSAISQRSLRKEFEKPWLSIGDAALSVDPISGSGVPRAFKMNKEAENVVLAYFEGRDSLIEQYEASRNEDCTNYLHERVGYYSMEKRWASSTFWNRRHLTF